MQVSPIDVQRYLGGVDYPVGRDGLVERARENGAPEDVVQALSDLPSEQFDGPDTVMKRLGG
jgi:hypothetical protein